MNGIGQPREWQAPPPEAPESYRLGWLNEATEQGAAWLQNQRGARDWKAALDIISGGESSKDLLDYRSHLSGRRLKTNIRTVVSGLANIRPLWGFRANEAFASYAEALNKTTWALYLENYWDQSIKECLAWAATTCTGFARPVWRRNLQGEGNLQIDTFGMPCVLPVQLPRDGNYQNAYAVTLLDEMPIFEAHWRFRDFQDRLKPTTSRYWYSPAVRKSAERNSWKRLLSFFRVRNEDKLTDQYIPVRWTTINDLRINDSGQRIPMGQPGSSWYYEVPSYGDEISDGAGGMRKADENDCKLYPQRRVIASSEDCIMYDGPGFNWDGQLDLVPFTVDRWPWEPIGFSMVHDGWELQKAIDKIDRGAMDKINAQQDPPLGYPIGGVTKEEAESFDPLAPRTRIGYDEQAVDMPFKLAVPLEALHIGQEALGVRQIFQDELDYTLQTRDVVEMAKARALGKGMDSMEALISAYGPIVKDIARGMEKSLGMLGSQIGWRILQYMPTARLMQYADPKTLALSVWDYDPASIVPSHLPGEDPHQEDQTPRASGYSLMQRAKWFAKNIRFFLMPHSVHETTQMTMRLGYMQLRQRGYPISAATVMNAWDVPNVGQPDGNTEQQMFFSEKEEEIIKAARLKKIVDTLGIDQGLMGPGGGPPQGKGRGGGRPNADSAAPQLKQKGDGRSVVTTSQ
jgi:hypothetical protein